MPWRLRQHWRRDSGHPIAAAFAVAARADQQAQQVETVTRAWRARPFGGRARYLGRADFAAGREDDGFLWLGDGQRGIGPLQPARKSTRRCEPARYVNCRHRDCRCTWPSGDGAEAVQRLADSLGITQAHARQTPEDKLALVRELQAQGRISRHGGRQRMYAGAGGRGCFPHGRRRAAGPARAADLVLTGATLMRIPAAILLARRTRAIIVQNLGWAMAYNLIALPVAAMGWTGMALSSLIVTVNALRLTRTPRSLAP